MPRSRNPGGAVAEGRVHRRDVDQAQAGTDRGAVAGAGGQEIRGAHRLPVASDHGGQGRGAAHAGDAWIRRRLGNDFVSEPFTPGTEWQHVAFTYDASGDGALLPQRRATRRGRASAGRGPVAPGKHALSIGDRVGSNYAGFPGFIDEVRICNGALEFRPIAVEFQRGAQDVAAHGEGASPSTVIVRNLGKAPAKQLALRVSRSKAWARRASPCRNSPPERRTRSLIDFDTTLRPDTYRLTARLEMPGECHSPARSSRNLLSCRAACREDAGD